MASTVKHLRSSTANKRPTASGLADGQLGINTASGTPGVFFKDSAGTVTKVGPAHVGSTAPNVSPAGSAGNSRGELWVNNSTTINGLNYYTGSAFVNLTPSGTTTVAGLVELATDAETQTGTDTIRAVTPSGLQSKISNSISTTSSTTIASATAVKTAYDLANAALPKSGGRVTGALEIGPAGSLSFEGSSDDSFETTIAVVNPTAARTITFPNVTGNVVTTGDSNTVTGTMIAATTITNAEISASAAIALSKLATGALPTDITVSSGNIVDGTITNADINASAAIVDTKLATISTAGKVSGTAITSGDIATSGNLLITSSTPVVRLTESDGTATHSQTSLARDNNQFAIQTRNSTGVALSSDYLIPANSSGATDHIWRIANTEKARLDNDGLKIVDDVRIGNSAGVNISSSSSNGHQFINTGAAYHAAAGVTPLFVGRNTNDGNLISFYQAGTFEGSVSVSGATVSYNPFLGSHWGRLVDGSKPDILPGTILDTVDQLIEWKQAKLTVNGEEKIAAYNGSAEAGDIVQIVYENTSHSAIVQNEEEDLEGLNKHVCVKVNDTASSKAVFGVFLGWDHDIPDNMVSTWNDLYCAAVGNYFVRIADGETLEIGCLIEADGNGRGVVQDDDIIRSKTVAKITSTIPQKVYDDGSFLVTCVLCCG